MYGLSATCRLTCIQSVSQMGESVRKSQGTFGEKKTNPLLISVLQVKKIFESERRLHAGDHSAELLAQDFEKNYNMYIYPVHWQFAQLDQHPSDRLTSFTFY